MPSLHPAVLLTVGSHCPKPIPGAMLEQGFGMLGEECTKQSAGKSWSSHSTLPWVLLCFNCELKGFSSGFPWGLAGGKCSSVVGLGQDCVLGITACGHCDPGQWLLCLHGCSPRSHITGSPQTTLVFPSNLSLRFSPSPLPSAQTHQVQSGIQLTPICLYSDLLTWLLYR